MAKKGQQTQLQTELNDDQEFAEFIQRDGLLLIDIYSDWCGPCAGMQATLKKIKVEVGGDLLQLAIAKCDNIEALARFRFKSEPTWLFISKGKVVNLLFGADAPKLSRIILSELKKESQSKEDHTDRNGWELDEMTEEEKQREEEQDSVLKIILQKEAEKKAEATRQRKEQETENILGNLSHYGTVVIFPHLRDRYKEVLSRELLEEAGVSINQLEKIKCTTMEAIEDLDYFCSSKIPKMSVEELLKKQFFALLIKRSFDNLPGSIDDIVLQLVYGNDRKPLGSPNSPSQKSILASNDNDDLENIMIGIWAPENARAKAMALKWFFPHISNPYKLPNIPIIPQHIAVAYEAFKSKEVFEFGEKYPGSILNYGFFTSDIVGEAQLIAKTLDNFENRTTPITYEERIVIQLSKENKECLTPFAELGPTYMSADAIIGEEECKFFFPSGYSNPEPEVLQSKKKSKRKRQNKPQIQEGQDLDSTIIEGESVPSETGEGEQNIVDEDHEETDEHEEQDDEEEEDEEIVENNLEAEDNTLIGADKSTSPMVIEERND